MGNKPKAGWSSEQSSEVQLSQEKAGRWRRKTEDLSRSWSNQYPPRPLVPPEDSSSMRLVLSDESFQFETWVSRQNKPAACPRLIRPGSDTGDNDVPPGDKVITLPHPLHHPNAAWKEKHVIKDV